MALIMFNGLESVYVPDITLLSALGIDIRMGAVNPTDHNECHAWKLVSYVYAVCALASGQEVPIGNMPRSAKYDDRGKLKHLLGVMYDCREHIVCIANSLYAQEESDSFLKKYIDNPSSKSMKDYYRLLSGHTKKGKALRSIVKCAESLSPCEHMLLDLNIIKGLLESCGVDTVNLYQKSHKDLVRDRAFIMSGDLFKELNEHFGPSSEGIDHDDKLIKELVRRALMAPSDGDHITTTDVVKVIILYSAANEKLDMALLFKQDVIDKVGMYKASRSCDQYAQESLYALCLQCTIAAPDVDQKHQGELQAIKERATELHRVLIDYAVQNPCHNENIIITCDLIKYYVSKMLENSTFDERIHEKLKDKISAVENSKIMRGDRCLGTVSQMLLDKADHDPALEQDGDTPDSRLCEVGVEHKMAATAYVG